MSTVSSNPYAITPEKFWLLLCRELWRIDAEDYDYVVRLFRRTEDRGKELSLGNILDYIQFHCEFEQRKKNNQEKKILKLIRKYGLERICQEITVREAIKNVPWKIAKN